MLGTSRCLSTNGTHSQEFSGKQTYDDAVTVTGISAYWSDVASPGKHGQCSEIMEGLPIRIPKPEIAATHPQSSHAIPG